jgi:hypothetical protein
MWLASWAGAAIAAGKDITMPFCTIVEFEWDDSFDHEAFARNVGAGAEQMPAGCLSRISSIDASGARMIEVWRSGEDARAFAEQSAPHLASMPMPAPSRVSGFEVTSYVVA